MYSDNYFFRYSVHTSYIHKINPVVKMICFFLYTFVAFFSFQRTEFIYISVIVNILFILFIFFLSKISLLSILNRLLKMKFLILFIFIFHLLSILLQNDISIINIKDIFNSKECLYLAVYKTFKVIFRLFKMLSISNALMVTTLPQEITRFFEILFSLLKIIKINIEGLMMMMTISIRFVSVLYFEMIRLYKAQISRGVKNVGFFNKIKMFFLIIHPLFNFIFRTSDDLVDALEARCYRLEIKRTHYRRLSFGLREIKAIIFIITFVLLFVIMKVLD